MGSALWVNMALKVKSPAAAFQAEFPNESIADAAPGKVTSDRYQVRKSGEQQRTFSEVAAFDEEGVEPGLEEVVDVDVTESGAEGGEAGGGMESGAPGEVVGVGGEGR